MPDAPDPATEALTPSKKTPRVAPREATAPPVDFETFDLGWNRAIDQAAATVKAAVQLGQATENGPSAELVAEIILGLKRVPVALHAPEEPFSHALRSDGTAK